ncbi:MAG: 2-oxoacid:acceptor oxidoreductase family protein, partial [Minisyncoccales bacterium]
MKEEKTILIGGQAGQGIAFTSHLLAKAFSRLGYFVFVYRDYQSLIKGGHNFNVIKISPSPVFSHQPPYDIIIALDQNTINLHEKNLKKDGFVLGSTGLKTERKFLSLDLEKLIKEENWPSIFGNNILLGFISAFLGVPQSECEGLLDSLVFEKKDLVKKSFAKGYFLAKKTREIKKVSEEKYLMSGNEAVAMAAVLSGLDIYFAYPMTPSTPVLHFLNQKQLDFDLIAFQLDDEIAVINSALGASFGGAKVMVGTSGGGFALMNEGLSLAGMAELPIVIYLSQRPGPATGVPTYTAQGDLNFALYGGHGEFPRIVLSAGTSQETILRIQQAFYLSWKFRTPAIFLGDKHLAENTFSFDKIPVFEKARERFILKKERKENYPFEEKGIYRQQIPGISLFARVSSYEHDPSGITSEDPLVIKKMHERRMGKLKEIEKEMEEMEPCLTFGQGKNLIISWGSTAGPILDALKELKDFRFLEISFLSPFPEKIVKKEIEKAKEVFLIENNISSP